MRWVLLVLGLGVVIGCSGDDGEEHEKHGGDQDSSCTATTAVSITGFTFSPACITVSPGATVTFTNDDDVVHTATTNALQVTPFDSGIMVSHATFTTPALAAGTIKGFCSVHAGMLFEIRVE